MTSEVEPNIRISKLEERVHKLEKIILENQDVLNVNFEGYETLTEEEMKIVEEAETEIQKGNIKSLEDIIEDLE
ncbi:MAG: hypothetical protein ACXAD7_14125 [Candidatus Kariarchaeaceae archaeon]|jgi:hypothetical protein